MAEHRIELDEIDHSERTPRHVAIGLTAAQAPPHVVTLHTLAGGGFTLTLENARGNRIGGRLTRAQARRLGRWLLAETGERETTPARQRPEGDEISVRVLGPTGGWRCWIALPQSGIAVPARLLAELEDRLHLARRELEGLKALEER